MNNETTDNTFAFKKELKQELEKLNIIYNKFLNIRWKKLDDFEDIYFVEADFEHHIERATKLAKRRYEILVQQEAIKYGSDRDPNSVKAYRKKEFEEQVVGLAVQEIVELKNTILANFKDIIREFDIKDIRDAIEFYKYQLYKSLVYFQKVSERDDVDEVFKNCGKRMVQFIEGADEGYQQNNAHLPPLPDLIKESEDICRVLEKKVYKPYKIALNTRSRSIKIQRKILSKNLSKMASRFKRELPVTLRKHKIPPVKKAPHHNVDPNKESRPPKIYLLNETEKGFFIPGVENITRETHVHLCAGDLLIRSHHGAETKIIGTKEIEFIDYPNITAEKRAKILDSSCYNPGNNAEYVILNTACTDNKDKLGFADILHAPEHTVRLWIPFQYHINYKLLPSQKKLNQPFKSRYRLTVPPKQAEIDSGIDEELEITSQENNTKYFYPREENLWKAYCMESGQIQFPLQPKNLQKFMPQPIENETVSFYRGSVNPNTIRVVQTTKPSIK